MTFHAPFERHTLAHVLCEIATVEREWRRKWGDDEGESDALDHLEDLRAEARARVQDMLGVSVDALNEAGL